MSAIICSAYATMLMIIENWFSCTGDWSREKIEKGITIAEKASNAILAQFRPFPVMYIRPAMAAKIITFKEIIEVMDAILDKAGAFKTSWKISIARAK
jgi:hypothetical protein